MKNIFKTSLVAMAVAIASLAAGCSDGDPWDVNDPGFNIIPPAPEIVRFFADDGKVKAGGSTTVHWEVVGADEVRIVAFSDSGDAVPFDVNTTELTGSAQTPGLTSTTHFTISASVSLPVEDSGIVAMRAQAIGEDEQADEGEVADEAEATEEGDGSGDADDQAIAPPTVITQTITVEVDSAMIISASMASDRGVIMPGEQDVIRWNVSPAEGVSIRVESDSGEPIVATDKCDGDIQDILGQPVAEVMPAVGCAVVAPETKTLYTVTATDAADPTNIAEASTEIRVEDVKVEAEIRVNGEKELKVASTETEVEVSWTVNPSDASVTVTASPAASCAPELPVDQASGSNKAKCKLSALPTTFSIEAKVGNMPAASAKADVIQGAVTAGIDVRSDEWAFEGETVNVWLDLREGIDPSSIREVLLTDKLETIKKVTNFPLSGPVSVVVPSEGVSVTMIDSSGEEHNYGTRVKALTTIKAVEGLPVTKLALDPNDPSTYLVGVMMSGYNDGKLRIIKNGNPNDFEFGPEIKRALYGDAGAKFMQDGALDQYVSTFPVNAIAVRPLDSQKVYMGTTGGVFASADGGQSYSIVGPAMYISKDGKDYSGSHSTCRGKIQAGVEAGFKGEVVALNQVCDVAVGASGRLIVATDMGLYSIANVDDFLVDKKSSPVKGSGSVISMRVTDDVECLDADCMQVLAATELGVFRSSDGGESWESFGEIGLRAFSLATLDGKVFAGTENGVFSAELSGSSWTKMGLEGSKVYSLAIDPNIGPNGMMLLAGTDSGVRVTRNSGKDWSSVDVGGSEESLSVAIASSGSGSKKIGVMIGSGSTAFFAETKVTALSIDGAKSATYKSADVKVLTGL